MKKLFVLTLLILVITSCNTSDNKENIVENITFIKNVSLQIPEPSGIDFNNGFLWIVSDENNLVYKTDTLGNIIESFEIDGNDLEGITIISDSTMAVALERSRTIVIANISGKELNRFSVEISGELNYGLEGITYNSSNSHFYILNEKQPGINIEIDQDYKEVNRIELSFASDYSGICYDAVRDAFWIVSDESQSISLCNYKFEVIEDYKVNIPQMEGISYDQKNNKLYIVSDKLESLFIYELKK